MTDQPATTKELFDRWRGAVQVIEDHEVDSPAWRAARFLADQAWNDYEHALDEERAAIRTLDPRGDAQDGG